MASADTRSTARRTLVVIGLVLATALLLLLISETVRVLVWIVVAAFFAVALHPAANWMQRRMPWCRRWLATLLLFLVVVLCIAGIVAALVVPLIRESGLFFEQFPRVVADVRAGRGRIGGVAERLHVLGYLEAHSDQLREHAANLGAPTLAILGSAATTVAGVITVFVLAYLMVLQAPKIVDGVLSLLEPPTAERVRRVGSACARAVTGYLAGNLLISLVCGLCTYAVLAILGVPFAALIAVFVGIADLIPLVGATLGATVAVVAASSTPSPRGSCSSSSLWSTSSSRTICCSRWSSPGRCS